MLTSSSTFSVKVFPGIKKEPCILFSFKPRPLNDLIECDVSLLAEIGLNRTQRTEFLDAMLSYLGYHLDAVAAVQSVRILREVF